MKILTRDKILFLMTAIVLLLTATCIGSDPEDIEDDVKDGPKYLGTKLEVKGEQVWMPNYNTGKVSELLLKFAGDRDVGVIVDYPSFNKIVSGKIKKGILEFKIDEGVLENTYLLDKDNLISHFFNDWNEDNNINITPSDVKGNIITVVTYKSDANPIEAVIREGFSGTDNSLTGEYIYYLYVDNNCKISAGKVEKTDLDYTFNKFDLDLKAGWNTICKRETYTTTGKSSYSISLSNPSIRWVIQKIK